ncbi:hypothetical protein ACFQFC_29060 [Amorphoplanes digitatis]|uniref:Uncharacterized protein n=1 Tax=Actinoplanes digitatis TaxID=1868 RepID=A0A7W7HSX3_9ACTN|nr:hypothetical protein [Actinoplanes digitatis]MBB4760197.1 hypothetical protein [Actinoplanes digitatis]GID94791.1 hypothetical protein Adi01nite_42030 [Actinoplanes digitatis]
MTAAVPAIAVPAFALTWWLGCYLVGRDPTRPLLWRSAAALIAYAVAVVAWTLSPASALAQLLLCVPALFWAGVAAGLLPRAAPEYRPANRGWPILAAVFLVLAAVLPGVGKLVALAPLAGAMVLLMRYRERVRPTALPSALAAAAALYALGLVVVLAPIDLGAPVLVVAAIGLDLLLMGFLVAVADAVDAGERLQPGLGRALIAGAAALLLCGGPAVLTMLAAPGLGAVTLLQFALVAMVVGAVGCAGQLRAGLDRLAFLGDERLRQDRAALLLAADALPRRRERHRMIALDAEEFQRLTRRALEDFGDVGRLLRNPLVDLPAVDRRLAARGPGVAEQPLVRAAELRAVLSEHVLRLKPAGAFGTTEEWRYFNTLYYCCVLGLRPYRRRSLPDGLDRDARRAVDWFRRYVPRRSLHRWQAEAANMVAAHLWRDLVSTDPRWLAGAGGARREPVR